MLERILPMPTEDWQQAPDIYLNVMSALAGPVQVMPAALASYRIHAASVSTNWPNSLALLRDRTLQYRRLEARARALGLAPADASVMTPNFSGIMPCCACCPGAWIGRAMNFPRTIGCDSPRGCCNPSPVRGGPARATGAAPW